MNIYFFRDPLLEPVEREDLALFLALLATFRGN